MFWGRKKNGLLPPKGIPDYVGRYLVVNLGKNPDWVWNLKAVMRSKTEDKDAFDVRVFDPAQVSEKGLKIRDYHSLDEHPDLILYEGWFNKRTGEVKIEAKEK
jgi:hypothetical protein